MKIPISAWIVAVVMLAACDRPASNGAGTPPAGTPELALSPTPPADIPPNASQADAVLYAWQSFVALNWPALSGRRGVPDPAKVIGQPGGVVWHTWKTPDEIFYPDGQAPPPWNQYGGQLPPQCVSVGAASNSFVLQRTSKVPGDINNAAIQAGLRRMPSSTTSVKMGTAATSAESPRLPDNGV